MNLLAYRLDAGSVLRACEPPDAMAPGASAPHWLHADSFAIDELPALLAQLSVPPFLENRLSRIGGATRALSHGDSMVLDLRVLPRGQEKFDQLAILCGTNLFVTLHPGGGMSKEDMDGIVDSLEIGHDSVAGLVCAYLHHEANRVAQTLRQKRETLYQLDERMDKRTDDVELNEILTTKDELLAIAAVAEEQEECFEAMRNLPPGAVDFKSVAPTVRLLDSLFGSNVRITHRLEKRVADLRQRYDTHQTDRTNTRLAVLTVISAVFMPLGLLAGIWGMNFAHMPELGFRYSYPGALVIMLLVACGMLAYFAKKGWFR